MKAKRIPLEIFSLSFLDVISCGFGAVVLLVLVSNHADSITSSSSEQAEVALNQVLSAEDQVEALKKQLSAEQDALSAKQILIAQLQQSAQQAASQLSDDKNQNEQLQADLTGLSLVETALKKAAISQRTTMARDEEVGGIPVDSDYVVFIIDTSGSMREIWNRVAAEIENVINIHPKIKGFQILNDNGVHLVSAYQGQWIPDTPARRAGVIKLFKGGWNSASNSSPVEGLEAALKLYAKSDQSVSIYVFGDDYTGSSYDPVIDTLVRLNTNKVTGKPLAKVHGVGFMSNYTTNRFSILMREVAKRNGGTFLALPR